MYKVIVISISLLLLLLLIYCYDIIISTFIILIYNFLLRFSYLLLLLLLIVLSSITFSKHLKSSAILQDEIFDNRCIVFIKMKKRTPPLTSLINTSSVANFFYKYS